MARNTISRPSYLNDKINNHKNVGRFIYKDVNKPKVVDVFINKLVFNFCPIFGISYIIIKTKL